MTLGPTIVLLPLAERVRVPIGRVLAVFGRVPLFYYLLHIPAIHAAALVVLVMRERRVNPWVFANHPMLPPPVPPGYMWSLPLLYGLFAIVECVRQLRGTADKRHVPNAKVALQHNLGLGGACVITMYRAD